MTRRLGPQQRILAQALHDGARLYRLSSGRWQLRDGETIRAVPGERCVGMTRAMTGIRTMRNKAMPIKDKSRYPADWKQISLRIRERDGWKCKQCGVPNKARGARDHYGEWHEENAIHAMNSTDGYLLFGDFPDMITIVLTCAHLDHDPSNNDDDNLAAYCQRCHLAHDRDRHTANAKATRKRKRHAAVLATGQGELPL